MLSRIISILATVTFTLSAPGQDAIVRNDLSCLAGEWKGEGSGIPGDGYISCRFWFEPDSAVLLCRSNSDFSPAGDFKRRTLTDEVLIIYLNSDSTQGKALSFSSMGNVVNYDVYPGIRSLILSGKQDGSPTLFRRTFFLPENGLLKSRFEIAVDGKNYITFTEGMCRKVR